LYFVVCLAPFQCFCLFVFCYLSYTLSKFFFLLFVYILLWTFLMNWTFINIFPNKSINYKVRSQSNKPTMTKDSTTKWAFFEHFNFFIEKIFSNIFFATCS
jgi:hypothetical protein